MQLSDTGEGIESCWKDVLPPEMLAPPPPSNVHSRDREDSTSTTPHNLTSKGAPVRESLNGNFPPSPGYHPQYLRTCSMDLQRLYGLDRSSVQFPDQLYQFLHEEGYVESIQNLPDGELSEFLDYLNGVRFLPLDSGRVSLTPRTQVLEQLDHTGQPFRKGLQVLKKVSGSRGTLPLLYQVPRVLPSISGLPVAFGGFCDVYKGKVDTGADVCIKKIRICSTDNVNELAQVGLQINSWRGFR